MEDEEAVVVATCAAVAHAAVSLAQHASLPTRTQEANSYRGGLAFRAYVPVRSLCSMV
ncbi:hypothetical protein GQ600_27051 [Phytophthora cactorum]|nr:hypothetical protein GQ600_27051 [Phytophthora cactorum]